MHGIISWNDSLQQISQKQDSLPLFCIFLGFGKFFTETKLSQVLYFPSSLFFCSWDIYQQLVRTGTLSVPFTFLPVGQPSKGESLLTGSERCEFAAAFETSSDYWFCKSKLSMGNLSSRPVCPLKVESRRKFMLLEYHLWWNVTDIAVTFLPVPSTGMLPETVIHIAEHFRDSVTFGLSCIHRCTVTA